MIGLRLYNKAAHTCKHICNSHKPTRKRKIAKELPSFPPKKIELKKSFHSENKKYASAQPDTTKTNETHYKQWFVDTVDKRPAYNSGLA